MSCPGRSDSRPRPSPWQAADVVEPCGSAFKRPSNTPTPEARKAVLLCVAPRQTAACAAHLSHDHSQRSPRCMTAGADGLHFCAVEPAACRMGRASDQRKPAREPPPQGACCRSSTRKTPAISPSTRRLRRSLGVPEEEAGPRWPRPLRSSVQLAAMFRTHAGPSASMGRLPCPASPLCTTNLRTNHRTARSLGGLDGEDGMIEQKKRGCRPSRLLILPTGNDQVFTNPSSQLSKAW